MNDRILVLDGNQRAALAAVRSLGAKGLWVAVGEASPSSLAGVSRFSRERVVYADPFSSPREFFNDILRELDRLSITFLLPITETTTYILLKYRAEIPERVVFPFPDSATVERIANKNELFALARQLHIPVPETTFCHDAQDGIRTLSSVTQFPLVIKPFKSKILLEDAIVTTQVTIAESREQALRALNTHEYLNFPFTMQSFIQGTGQGIFTLFNHGEPVCYFAHRRIREKPPGGGVSVLSESAPIDETLRTAAEALLRKVGWHGVAMVEFRVADDGTGYLMEVNPRLWGSLQLAIDSGVDFPWLLYLVSTGQDLPPINRQHRRLRWLLGDLDRLYLVLKAPSSAYSIIHKAREVLRFFRPGRQTRHEVNRWQDLRPFWFELKQYIGALRKR